jgi:hypothetical protein
VAGDSTLTRHFGAKKFINQCRLTNKAVELGHETHARKGLGHAGNRQITPANHGPCNQAGFLFIGAPIVMAAALPAALPSPTRPNTNKGGAQAAEDGTPAIREMGSAAFFLKRAASLAAN